MYYVYFLKSKLKPTQTYVGYSTDLKRRFTEHNAGKSFATKSFRPWELIFYEAYKVISDAKRREEYFKTTAGRKALKIMLRDSLV